ncbi:MAG: DUF6073 family protein [bacterium]
MSLFKCKKPIFSLLVGGLIMGLVVFTLAQKSDRNSAPTPKNGEDIQYAFVSSWAPFQTAGAEAGGQRASEALIGSDIKAHPEGLAHAEQGLYEYNEGDTICIRYRVWWAEPPAEPTPLCLWPELETFPQDALFDPHSGCVCDYDTAVVIVCWVPDYCDAGEYTWVYYYAAYGCEEPSGVLEAPITVHNVNRCPSIQADPPGPFTVSAGECVHVDVTATDPDMTECGDDNILLFAANMPPGATFVDNGGGDGDFDWCATESSAGQYTVTFYAYDLYECVDSATVEITPPSCPPTGYPQAGTDAFPSSAGLQVYFPGIGGAVVKLEGQTTVQRGEPTLTEELMTIDTEIIDINLTGSDPILGPITLALNPQYPSTGQITQLDPEEESPMENFFDVYVELYTEIGVLHNEDPIRMRATIESIPPRAGVYEYVGEPHLPLYDGEGIEMGYIVNVKHVTQPPRDRFQSTATFKEVEIYGVGTDTNIVVVGPTEVVRSDWVGGVVTTEMVELNLTGSGPSLGPITVTEDPSKISTGQVSSMLPAKASLEPSQEFPADSWFNINLEIETGYGTGTACAPVQATIDSFPPIGAEYVGPHDVDLVDESGQVIGRIRRGFVHLPEEPLEPPPISTLPPAGWDCFDSEAQITLQIGQDQETVLLTGPTIVSRGDPQDPGDGLPEVQTEIIFMALEGSSVLLGGPITIAECDTPSPGKIKQLKPELGLPAISDFTVNFDLLTPYGTYWGQQGPVVALIDSIPPENEEYQGPHPVVITDPTTGEDIGQIIDFIHIPKESIPCPDIAFPVPCPPCETGQRGDANGDGTINVLDALTVVNHILEIAPCPDLCWCDCNCDDAINVLDVLCIVNIILEIYVPDTGVDYMATTAVITLQVGEMTVPNVTVTGATQVQRGVPYDPGDGKDKIDTEIVSMDLTGTSQLGPITVTESPDYASTGYIQAYQTGRDFPAGSFFDIFVEIDIPDVGTVHNEDPIPMRAKIDTIPPTGRIYYPPYRVEIPVYGPKGDLIGYIVHVTHKIDSELPVPPTLLKSGRSSVIIEVEEKYAKTGERILLPVSVEAGEAISGVQFTLSYNASRLTPLTPQLTERSAEMELASNAVDGELMVLIYSLEGKAIPAGHGPIVQVPFKVADFGRRTLDFGLEFKEVIVAGEDCCRALPVEVRPITVKFDRTAPEDYALHQCYPNPFNPVTSIQYSVISDQSPPHVTLKIYNLLGQEVRTLVDEPKEPGYYTVTWDGRDEEGDDASSGVYFYRLQAGSFVSTKRMVLIR